MSISNLLLLSCITIALVGCRKDKTLNPATDAEPVVTSNYTQLKVGNYWIYQRFKANVDGTETAMNDFDSCYVEKDTVIHGQTYFKFIRDNEFMGNVWFVRDSLQYMVRPNGAITFSSGEEEQPFSTSATISQDGDTLWVLTVKMADKDSVVSTPAGNFETINYQVGFRLYPAMTTSANFRSEDTRYANEVGIVEETLALYLMNPEQTIRKLVRYHLN